jgi:hypothetical protein
MYSESNPKLWKGRVDSQNDPKQFKHFQTVTFAKGNWANAFFISSGPFLAPILPSFSSIPLSTA